jgi:hypothetical protein
MRIGDYTNITAAGNNNVSDPISNLEKGDVIRAKVIEVTSDEAVLRLSNGSIIKAKTLEVLNAKSGQTITLTVASKSEGTVILESVKDATRIDIKPDILKSLLETIGIRPNVRNMELASEFLKEGAPITADNMEAAAELMKSMPGLSPEKTAFLVSRGLDAGKIQIDVLNRFLDGDLKLGHQLKEIQAILTQISDTQENVQASRPVTDMQAKISNEPVNQQLFVLTKDSSVQVSTSQRMAENVTNPSPSGTIEIRTGEEGLAPEAIADDATFAGNLSEKAAETPSAEKSSGGMPAEIEYEQVSTDPKAEQQSSKTVDTPNMMKQQQVATQTSTLKESGQLSARQAEDGVSSLVEAVKELFVKTDSSKLASEIDMDKLNNDLAQRMELLKAATSYSQAKDSNVSKDLSTAANLVSNTLKLINHLNENNMLYYQIPINLSGYETTAELYIMKRGQQTRKRIDAHNTLMFISLDTNNMGRIETLADVKDDTITINIRTESNEINDFIKENAKHLYSGIKACGYRLAGIRYAVIDSPATPMQQEKLLSAMQGLNHGKVDYRI